MGNIVGEGFDSAIHQQVNIRQLLQGSGYLEGELRTNEQLVVLNNNTAWIKLMSSVSINSPIEINNPTINRFNEPGDVIAKSFVLFNGTSAYDNKTIQRGGIDFTNTLGGYNNVYGIGGSADFGLNPMMGITGIDVKHKNRGSIRTATVTVKAFNRTQFEIIDVLYMRLGFSVLLEWGNSIYINNNGDYVKDGGNLNSLIDPWFKGSNYNSFLTKIRNQSFASNGNYDGMLAKVSNYHWSFKKDGSYDITIDLVSMGDVIESLNTGVSPNSVLSNSSTVISGNSSLFNKLQLAASQNKWGEEFYSKFVELSTGLIPNSRSVSSYEKIKGIEQIQYHYVKSFREQKDYLFIKLGKILQILENKIVLKDNNNNKMLNFDYNYKSNLVKIIKRNTLDSAQFPNNIVINQMSYNPFKCVTLKDIEMKSVNTTVNYQYRKFHDSLENIYNNNLFPDYYAPLNLYIPKTETTENFDHNDGYGRIMNILVNAEFVLDVVDEKTNKETGELPLIDFLKGILAGINESLGGITELDVWIDETINTVKIIDKNSSGERSSDPTTFDLYGYNSENSTSNFIHDFELKTEITPALSTMITVAATANKTVVGADNTALSKINKGLTDRYKSNLSSNQTQPSTILLYPNKTDPEYDVQFQAWQKKNNIQIYLANPFPETDPITIIMIANKKDPNDMLARAQAEYDLFEGNEGALPNIYEITETKSIKPKFSNNYLNHSGQNFISGPSSMNSLRSTIEDVKVKHTLEPGITALPHTYTAPTAAQTYLSAAYNIDQSNYVGEKSFWFSLYNMLIGIWTDDEIKTMESRFKGINDKWNAWKHPNNPNDSFKSGFIPFNLSLTMDGLGGMKIYQKFSVNTDFMPSNYPENIEFLIKNIQHTVKDNKWITKLESFCVSKPDKNAKLTSTPTVTATGLGGGGAITGTNTKTSAFGGLRGDLFSWVAGPNFPDPSDPNNYNGTIYSNSKFNEVQRQGLLTFQTKGYIVDILRSTEAKVIARNQDFISKPTLPLTFTTKILNCKNGKKTGYYYNTVPFTETEQEKMFTDILIGIGATSSKYNLLWMKVWRDAEGAVATYNPWNSTQPVTSGTPSTRYNCQNVQNYFTFQDGVDATIKTLTNGYYPHIIKALQNNIKDYAEMKELATLVQMWDMTGKIPSKWL